MKVNSANTKYLIFYMIFLIYISSLEAKIFLEDEPEVIFSPIEGKSENGIFEAQLNIVQKKEIYYYYEFPTQNQNHMVMTLNGNKEFARSLDIYCILSNSESHTQIKGEIKEKNICQLYKIDNHKLMNILIPLDTYEEGAKLYFQFYYKSPTIDLNLYFREDGSYQTKLDTKVGISNGYAFMAFEFNKNDYNEKQYFFISSAKDSILAFGKQDNRLIHFDTTSILPITEHSLASIFWNYESIIIFVGLQQKQESGTDNIINLTLKEITNNDIKIHYYNGLQITTDFISLYDSCFDRKTEYYLIVNYRKMENDFYCKIHNLIGSKSSLIEFPIDKYEIETLDFEEVNRYQNFTLTDYHLHIWKFKCPGDGSKLIANIKYTKNQYSNSEESIKENDRINDYKYTFGTSDFTLDYSGLINKNSSEFALEIITPNKDENEEFKVTFEEKTFIINNKYAKIFHIVDEEKTKLVISTEQRVNAIISVIPSSIDKKYKFSEEEKFERTVNGGDGDYFYYAYYIEHEINANFNISFEIENPNNEKIQFCSYIITMPLIQTNALNCLLIPAKTTQNVSIANIFSKKDNENYNLEEPYYSMVVYSQNNYIFKKLYLSSDTPKSTPIDKYAQGLTFYYLDADIEQNKDYYYSIDLTHSDEENTFDIYILNDISKYEKQQLFDIKCISVYEFGIKYIENLFVEDNNLCHVMNDNKDFNSNVSHIIYKNTDQNIYHKFTIKIRPSNDLKIKFVIRENNHVNRDYEIDEKNKGINNVGTPNVFTFYEFNKSDLEKYKSLNTVIFFSLLDDIEIYGRNQNDFKQLDKNSFILFTINDYFNSNKYEKYLIGFGKTSYSDKQDIPFKYQLLIFKNLYYQPIEEFGEHHRIPMLIKECSKDDPTYIILKYKNSQEKNIILANYTLIGKAKVYYIDNFDRNDFEQGETALSNFTLVKKNKLDLSVIKIICDKKYKGIFDYFTEIPQTDFKLEEGTINHYIIPKGKKLNFTYENISQILIETNSKAYPEITFENRKLELKISKTYYREKDEINELYVETKYDNNALRIIPYVNLKNLETSEVDENLKIKDNKFIYEFPKNAKNVTLTIKPKSSQLRALQVDDMEICYTGENIIILDDIEGECFTINGDYNLTYSIPQDESEKYLILYPFDSTKKFTVERVLVDDGEGKKNNEGKTGDGDGDDDDDGSKAWIIVLIIILIIIIIVVAVILFFRMRNKRVTNADIEKDVKRTPSLTAIN